MIYRHLYRMWDYKIQCMMFESYESNNTLYPGKFIQFLNDTSFLVMQCTGSKDKYGKLIYEADLVKTGYFINNIWYDFIGVIKWDKKLCSFIQWIDYGGYYEDYSQLMDANCEVIGNICQNKNIWLESANKAKELLYE